MLICSQHYYIVSTYCKLGKDVENRVCASANVGESHISNTVPNDVQVWHLICNNNDVFGLYSNFH